MGIVKILCVCLIYISRWCNIELHGRRFVLFSHLQRCFPTRARRQKGECQRQCPENRTCGGAKGRCGNKCWNLDSFQEAARHECLVGLYQPRERCFQRVRCQLQLAKDPLDVSLGRTDLSIWSLATVFLHETWTSTYNKHQGRLECFQSQSQLAAASITFQQRIFCIEIRELNLQALVQRREISAATCKVLPSGADLAAPRSPQSSAEPEFMVPQNRHDGKHPDAMIKDFRALLDITQDTTHRVTIYNGMCEFFKHKSRNKTHISDEHLHTIQFWIYYGIKVDVYGVEGERPSQICWCTGSQSWCGGDQRNDWVWVNLCPGRCYGALNGRLPWQLWWVFKIKFLNEEAAFVEYW